MFELHLFRVNACFAYVSLHVHPQVPCALHSAPIHIVAVGSKTMVEHWHRLEELLIAIPEDSQVYYDFKWNLALWITVIPDLTMLNADHCNP